MFAKVVVQSKVMNVSMYRCFDFDLCVHSNDKSEDTNDKHLVGDKVGTHCGFVMIIEGTSLKIFDKYLLAGPSRL